eukprot:350064-Chlamydomonas_euryale.AAC.5
MPGFTAAIAHACAPDLSSLRRKFLIELATEATQRASVQDSSSRCSASGYRQPYVLEEVGISFALLEPIW